jgi:hypothetical protein
MARRRTDVLISSASTPASRRRPRLARRSAAGIGFNRFDNSGTRRRAIGVENTGLHVQGLGADREPLGNLLQHISRWLPETALNLAEIRVRHTGQFGQPPNADARHFTLRSDELPEIGQRLLRHTQRLRRSQ